MYVVSILWFRGAVDPKQMELQLSTLVNFIFLLNIFSDAENGINHTMASVYIDIDQMNMNMNMTCANLGFCHNRGQCIYIANQLKCL